MSKTKPSDIMDLLYFAKVKKADIIEAYAARLHREYGFLGERKGAGELADRIIKWHNDITTRFIFYSDAFPGERLRSYAEGWIENPNQKPLKVSVRLMTKERGAERVVTFSMTTLWEYYKSYYTNEERGEW